MSRTTSAAGYLAAALGALSLAASSAVASPYSQVLHAYETKGSVPPCQFSSSQLERALHGVDTYGAQYFADFTNAIQNALSARGSGDCSPGARAATARGSSPPLPLGPVTAATRTGIPAPILLLGALLAVFALTATTVAVARVAGFEPLWVAGCRHAFGEAGYRFGGAWSEFADWLHSGRTPATSAHVSSQARHASLYGDGAAVEDLAGGRGPAEPDDTRSR